MRSVKSKGGIVGLVVVLGILLGMDSTTLLELIPKLGI